nr:PqqD family peptide modification chaperone [Chitinophagales bacterium]
FQEHKTMDEVVKQITKEYRIDKDTVEKDLYDFQNMLQSYKLSE